MCVCRRVALKAVEVADITNSWQSVECKKGKEKLVRKYEYVRLKEKFS